MDDCAHLRPPILPEKKRQEFLDGLAPHQRRAREKGIPSIGAGAIYPVDEDFVFVDPFPVPRHWPRAYGMDVGWKVTAALLAAKDLETDTIYITNEYYGSQALPVVHAHSIMTMLPFKGVRGAIDPASNASGQADGQKLKAKYVAFGMNLSNANNAVEAGIHECLTRYQGGRLKVFNTLPVFRNELRFYRRVLKKTESGERSVIVKANDHLMDCKRYVVNTQGIWTQWPTDQAPAVQRYGEF